MTEGIPHGFFWTPLRKMVHPFRLWHAYGNSASWTARAVLHPACATEEKEASSN